MLKIYDEAESRNKVAGLRCMMNRNCQMRGRVKIYGDPESPTVKHEARLRYMMSRNRQLKRVFEIYEEMNRSRQMRGRVEDT